MSETVRKIADRLLAPLGLKLVRARIMRDAPALFLLKSREAGVNTLLDVGANVGQFVQSMRQAGWQGQAVSFEPSQEAHGLLRANAAGDGAWSVPPRMALGSANGEAEINISGNSASSSMLQIEAASTQVLPLTGYIASEPVPVRRLDDVMAAEWAGPYAMKIDTQGFELEVLKGAEAVLDQTAVILVELSLAGLYAGGARPHEVFALLESRGFRAITVTEGFSDTARNEVLQVDAVFVRG
jgi:FkbM family methyltransferase